VKGRREVPPVPWTPTTPKQWSPDEAYLKRHGFRYGFRTIRIFRTAVGWYWERLNGRSEVVAAGLESFETSFAAILDAENCIRESAPNYDFE
jgi:hypothetical protein